MSQSPIVFTILLLQPNSSFPLLPQRLVIPCAKPNTPSLKNNHLHFLLTFAIDHLPLRLGHAITLSRKCGLVVLRDGGGTAGAERLEDLFSQGEIVGRWLAAMLEKWVGGM